MHNPVALSVIVPVYKEERNIPVFLDRVLPILRGLDLKFEVIFALDPSPDGSAEVIRARHQEDASIKLLLFSRRFGQPNATIAGLTYASGDAVIVMDVDLQDPPELIAEMVRLWNAGYDVVYAQRRSREGEAWLKKLVAYMGYKVINRIAEVEIPPNTGDFRLMSRRVVNEVLRLRESHGFLRGMVALVGFKQTAIQFDRSARLHGSGNYNRFFGSIRIGLNGIVCFSNYLLSMTSVLGFVVAFSSFVLLVVYLAMKVAGFPFPLGNPTIVILVLLLGGVQLISVGVLGEYIGRIYDEVKRRPMFIVDEALGFLEKPILPSSDCPHCLRSIGS